MTTPPKTMHSIFLVLILSCSIKQHNIKPILDEPITISDGEYSYYVPSDAYRSDIKWKPNPILTIKSEDGKSLAIDYSKSPLTVYGDLELDKSARIFFEYTLKYMQECECNK
jgi:hypothetical protein